MIFKNRSEAGKILAEKITSMNLGENAIVLALPRGGVPVAWEIADKLRVPLDVLFVKKIPHPQHPELAVGAISESGQIYWDEEVISWLDLSKKSLLESAKNIHREIIAKLGEWRQRKLAKGMSLNVSGQTVILVDDGLATGATMRAAIQLLKSQNASRIIVAVPVGAQNTVEILNMEADEIIVLKQPSPFYSVGQWYEDFTQVTDEQVKEILDHGILEDFETVTIPQGDVTVKGHLVIPEKVKGLVIFAHGSGSNRKSPRQQKVSQSLNKLGFATLLFDLLTAEEARERKNVFDIPFLAERLRGATKWARAVHELKDLPIGYFGASTGAAAALTAATHEPNVKSIVSRGGRPDLMAADFNKIRMPVLLIVGGEDHDVIELNARVKARLPNAEISIVPGAGHLFEEKGTLEKVIELSANWFEQTLLEKKEKVIASPNQRFVGSGDRLARSLEDDRGFSLLAQELSKYNIVMLGEASHGTEEFYEIRRRLTEILIEGHGFSFVAVEGDWPDCYRLNRYIQNGEGASAKKIMSKFGRWPTWMWANEQTEKLIEWMRSSPNHPGFYGLDVYSLYESMEVIKEYAKNLSPDANRRVLEAYSCFESFDKDEIAYARSLVKFPAGCAAQAVEALRSLLRERLESTALAQEQLFDARQNAKILTNAEQYYRAMVMGDGQSWNIRDSHMLDTLESLMNRYQPNAKGIVWAHNTHIGDYHATDMVIEGSINLGGIAREKWGIENIGLVGFGTYQGKVLAGRAWGARPEIMELPMARENSVESFYHQTSQDKNLNAFFVPMKVDSAFDIKRGHRAVGVVYQPEYELHGRNYVPTALSKRYDYFVFVDKSNGLRALPAAMKAGLIPETWPAGA